MLITKEQEDHWVVKMKSKNYWTNADEIAIQKYLKGELQYNDIRPGLLSIISGAYDRLNPRYLNKEETCQDMEYFLYSILDKYKPERGSKFFSFATFCVQNEIRRAGVQQNKIDGNKIYLASENFDWLSKEMQEQMELLSENSDNSLVEKYEKVRDRFLNSFVSEERTSIALLVDEYIQSNLVDSLKSIRLTLSPEDQIHFRLVKKRLRELLSS